MKENKMNKKNKKQSIEPIRIFTAGAECASEGGGPCYAWYRPDTGKKKIFHEDGLTDSQAEYMAILAAINACPDNTIVEILTNSEATCRQIMRDWPVRNLRLYDLRSQVLTVMGKKGIVFRVTWVPGLECLAQRLI